MMEQWELARDMTLRGYHFNREERDRMLTDLIMQTASRASWLESCVPEQISKVVSGKPYFTSPIAMANLLYERLGLEQQKHKKTKKPTTDDSALSELAEKYPWYGHWLDTLSEWRSMNKFREFLEAKEGPDGRMHPQFNVAQPETFRWSSSENSFGEATNNQNIPKVED
jgi:DNA polymerase I-like protein with 3'-5' exonuclease and polymerase domains